MEYPVSAEDLDEFLEQHEEGLEVSFVSGDHCLQVLTDLEEFGAAIDTGFNGNALVGSNWPEKYEWFLAQHKVSREPLQRTDCWYREFALGDGQESMSSQCAQLLIYTQAMYRDAKCRISLGNTGLLLGNIWALGDDVSLRPKTGEIKCGDQSKREQLAYSQKGHMVLALHPKLQTKQQKLRLIRKSERLEGEIKFCEFPLQAESWL